MKPVRIEIPAEDGERYWAELTPTVHGWRAWYGLQGPDYQSGDGCPPMPGFNSEYDGSTWRRSFEKCEKAARRRIEKWANRDHLLAEKRSTEPRSIP